MEILNEGLGGLIGQGVEIGLLVTFMTLIVRRGWKKEDERDKYAQECDREYIKALANLTKSLEILTESVRGDSRRVDENAKRLEEINVFLITKLK